MSGNVDITKPQCYNKIIIPFSRPLAKGDNDVT